MSVSRLAGLKGRFSSWRRKRKSIPAVAVSDEDDEEDANLENVVDSEEPNDASSPSKLEISQAPRAETASTATRAEPKTAARRLDVGGKPLGEDLGMTATAKISTAANVVTDGQVAARDVLLPLTESVSGGSAAASPEENVPLASVGALAIAVASENRGEIKDAAVPAAARTVGASGSENERKGRSSQSKEERVARITTADSSDRLDSNQNAAALAGDDEPPAEEIEGERGLSQTASTFAGSWSSSGASSETGECARAGAKLAGETSVGGEADVDTSREQHGPPSSSSVAAIAPSKPVSSAVPPFADMDSGHKGTLNGGPDVETPRKKGRPSSTRSPVESAVAAVVNIAEEVVTTPPVSTVAGSKAANEQGATEAAALTESAKKSANSFVSSISPSSPVPMGTALSPSRNDSSRNKKDNTSETAQKMVETPAKTEEKGGLAGEAGAISSVGKTAVIAPNAAKEGMAAAVKEAAPRVAGKADGVGGGSGTVEGPGSAWNAMNPAAEFLRDWVDKAVPQKRAELKRRESAVSWERQWCVELGVVGIAAVRCFFGTAHSGLYSRKLLPGVVCSHARRRFSRRRRISM